MIIPNILKRYSIIMIVMVYILTTTTQVFALSDLPRIANTVENADDSTDSNADDSTDSNADDSTDSNADDSTDSNADDSTDLDADDSTDSNADDSTDLDADDSTDLDADDSTDLDADDSTDLDADDSTDLDADDSTDLDADDSTDLDADDSTDLDADDSTDLDENTDTNAENNTSSSTSSTTSSSTSSNVSSTTSSNTNSNVSSSSNSNTNSSENNNSNASSNTSSNTNTTPTNPDISTNTDTSTKVRVAFIPDGNFYAIDNNGNYSGYNYDYLIKVSQFTNWSFDFVLIDEPTLDASYAKAHQMLLNGELDLLGSQEISANTTDLNFGQKHYGVVRSTLSTLANNNKITLNNFFTKSTLRAALIDSNEQSVVKSNQLFYEIMEKYEIEPIVTLVANRDAALELLIAEKVDVMMNTDFSVYHNTLTTLYSDNPTPIYFASNNKNTELLNRLDVAISQIELTSPDVLNQLQDKYFGMSHKSALIRTNEENKALENIEFLTVGLIAGVEPYQFYKKDDLEFSGISVEILEQISKIIDLPFEYKWYETYEDLSKDLANKTLDIFATLPTDYEMAKKLNVTLSDPYLSNGAIWLHHSDTYNYNDRAYQFYVSDTIPYYHSESLEYIYNPISTIEEISKDGKFVLYVDPYIAQYHLQSLGITNVESKVMSNVYSNISMGVAPHIDPIILGLLNHSILHLNSYEIDEIIYRNTIVNEALSFDVFLRLYTNNIIRFLLVFFIIITGILCFYAYKFRNLSRQDSLTKLTNAGYFHEYCEEKIPKLKNGCLILIDIDYFKQINDTHGHQAGDTIIKSVSDTLRNNFREQDLVARLGGDEFVILLEYEATIEDLNSRAQHLLDVLSTETYPCPITLSIGGVIFGEGMFYDSLYRLTDQVLYTVKENGRNGYVFREHF